MRDKQAVGMIVVRVGDNDGEAVELDLDDG